MTSLLALDVGGTKLAVAAGGRHARTETPPTGPEALEALIALAASVVEGAVDGIGVSFGGHVVDGHILRSLHVPGWEDAPLTETLRERFGAPALIANDGNAGALGEWDAAGRPDAPVAYVTVSTGVGGGIVVGGEIFTGVDGLAAEIGHLIVDPEGEACPCGRRGCVETIASGPAIERRGGDYAGAAQALAFAISALISLLNPAVVAVGGGVTAAGDRFWGPLRAELDGLAWPDVTTIVRPSVDDAALRGAMVLAARAAGRVH